MTPPPETECGPCRGWRMLKVTSTDFDIHVTGLHAQLAELRAENEKLQDVLLEASENLCFEFDPEGRLELEGRIHEALLTRRALSPKPTEEA